MALREPQSCRGVVVILAGVLGAAALSAACGDSTTEPPPSPRPPNPGPPPSASRIARLAGTSVAAPEGGTATLQVVLNPAPDSPIALSYTLGMDGNADTDDADESDHAGGGGTIRIAAGSSGATIEIAIRDDDDIEPTREVFTLTLGAPGSETGYVLGSPNSAVITIEEGVCDRTPQVRDAIGREAGVTGCARIDDGDLGAIRQLDLSSGGAGGQASAQHRRDRRGSAREADLTTDLVAGSGEASRAESAISALREKDFSGLPNLLYIFLEQNELTELPPGVFADLPSLQELWLDGNRLTSIPDGAFSGAPELVRLFLEKNELTELPEGVFAGLSRLKVLWMFRNQLRALPDGVFSGLTQLVQLSLGANELTMLPDGVFAGLSELEELFLYETQLAELPPRVFEDLSNIEELWLDTNQLASLPEGAFRGLSGLTKMSLANNHLAALPRDVFLDLSSLTSLSLAGNRLASLPEGVFLGLSSVTSLSLADNPGAPFPLALQVERTDGQDDLAPAPATIAVTVVEGSPFPMTIPLAVYGGELSTDVAELEPGNGRSADITVTRSGGETGSQVALGPAPSLPAGVAGIQVRLPDPLVLFEASSNRAPVIEHRLPGVRLLEGGGGITITASRYFRDPDEDELEYAATSGDPTVASTSVTDSVITLSPAAAGVVTVVLAATDPGGYRVETSLETRVRAPAATAFDIDLILTGELTASQEAAFRNASERWMSVLRDAELPDVSVGEDMVLGCWDIVSDQVAGTVDELTIVSTVAAIDGPGSFIALAGPCGIRREGQLPFLGAMKFDIDDLAGLEEDGDLEDVILHEMGHVLGIGTRWEPHGLLANPTSPTSGEVDTHFTGPLAIDAFDAVGGASYTGGGKVPVENQLGQGSYNTHWRESVFDHELMTAIQNKGVSDPLSAVTIQSLADLGYVVDPGSAETFRLPGADAEPEPDAAGAADLRGKIVLGDDTPRGPIMVVDREGRVVRVIWR